MRIEMGGESTLSPDQVVAALIDFSERRPQMWTGITPSYYEVYSVGENEAHVREGTKQGPLEVWAKEHYEWKPGWVRWTVEEANFCTPGSYVEATITERPGGGSKIHTVWERTPTTFMSRIIFGMMKLTGGKPIESSMRKGLANYERELSAS
ncbi:MAG: hypothetical protein QOG16_1139 [Actinomycetota bacterium]|jgi:hypothetical protein|nr:hypothetical protein [Actinomycetota bacterium]